MSLYDSLMEMVLDENLFNLKSLMVIRDNNNLSFEIANDYYSAYINEREALYSYITSHVKNCSNWLKISSRDKYTTWFKGVYAISVPDNYKNDFENKEVTLYKINNISKFEYREYGSMYKGNKKDKINLSKIKTSTISKLLKDIGIRISYYPVAKEQPINRSEFDRFLNSFKSGFPSDIKKGLSWPDKYDIDDDFEEFSSGSAKSIAVFFFDTRLISRDFDEVTNIYNKIGKYIKDCTNNSKIFKLTMDVGGRDAIIEISRKNSLNESYNFI